MESKTADKERLLCLKEGRNLQIQEALQIPNRMNPRESTLKHITFKLLKMTNKNLKHLERNNTLLKVLFTSETMEAISKEHARFFKY
jgi:translation initiation factor 2 beta subunit (eIF-2beta)/eIF-5